MTWFKELLMGARSISVDPVCAGDEAQRSLIESFPPPLYTTASVRSHIVVLWRIDQPRAACIVATFDRIWVIW